jgi:hypothetical protein
MFFVGPNQLEFWFDVLHRPRPAPSGTGRSAGRLFHATLFSNPEAAFGRYSFFPDIPNIANPKPSPATAPLKKEYTESAIVPLVGQSFTLPITSAMIPTASKTNPILTFVFLSNFQASLKYRDDR